MTTTSGAPMKGLERTARLPFAIAFGFALASSSAAGAALPALTHTTTSVRELSHASPRDYSATIEHTNSGLPAFDQSQSNEASTSAAQRISELRALTGLTTDQVSRLFGVSRRSVHNWIRGCAMSLQHEERAAKLLAIVQVLPGSTPAERRAKLLDSSRGSSLFHQLVAARAQGERLQVPGVSVLERIAL